MTKITATSGIKWKFTFDRDSFSNVNEGDWNWSFWKISRNSLKTISCTDLHQAKPKDLEFKWKTVPYVSLKHHAIRRSFAALHELYFLVCLLDAIIRYDFKLNVFETGKYYVSIEKRKKRSLRLASSSHDLQKSTRRVNCWEINRDVGKVREMFSSGIDVLSIYRVW